MEERIFKVLKDTFNLDQVDTTLSQANCIRWDSMNHLNLIIALESEFEVSFEPEEMAVMKSYEIISAVLKEKLR